MITPENLPIGSLVRVKGRRGPWRYLGDGWFGPKNVDGARVCPLLEDWVQARAVVDSGLPPLDALVDAMLHRGGAEAWHSAYGAANRLRWALEQEHGCWGDVNGTYAFTNQWITILQKPA